MARTIIGPTRVATDSGSFFHSAIASWNFGFVGLTFGSSPRRQQLVLPVQRHRLGAPLLLELVGAFVGVERPKSNIAQRPSDCAYWIASQYSRRFGHSALKSRIDDAHGISTIVAVR